MVFVFAWIFPFINRMYDITAQHEDKPPSLVYLHDVCFASIGWLNALVWGTSDLWKQRHRAQRLNRPSRYISMVDNNSDGNNDQLQDALIGNHDQDTSPDMGITDATPAIGHEDGVVSNDDNENTSTASIIEVSDFREYNVVDQVNGCKKCDSENLN